MKKNLILCLSILPLFAFSQPAVIFNKKDLFGTWIIKEMRINGASSNIDPSIQDEFILRGNDTYKRTDKAFNYEQSGPWRIVDNKYIEITNSADNKKQQFEITYFENLNLKLTIKSNGMIIEMTLFKSSPS